MVSSGGWLLVPLFLADFKVGTTNPTSSVHRFEGFFSLLLLLTLGTGLGGGFHLSIDSVEVVKSENICLSLFAKSCFKSCKL